MTVRDLCLAIIVALVFVRAMLLVLEVAGVLRAARRRPKARGRASAKRGAPKEMSPYRAEPSGPPLGEHLELEDPAPCCGPCPACIEAAKTQLLTELRRLTAQVSEGELLREIHRWSR